MKKKILILGSTGSIGRNCLEVIRANPNKFEVVGLSAHSNVSLFMKQVEEFKPRYAAVSNPAAFLRFKKRLKRKVRLFSGPEGLEELVESFKGHVVVSAIVGSAGLIPTLAAIKKGIRVAIANKEPLVMAGRIMTREAKKYNAEIIPIDSEHSAVWQCLNGEKTGNIEKIILTASGGPFFRLSKADLKKVTLSQALKHPKWKMGPKITVDSSTLMNKGLEVIEAHWLFSIPWEKLEVVIHPQSIVHSLVEFSDSSVMAQLGIPDMKIPIAYALSYPDRWPVKLKRLSLVDEGRLDFFPPDLKKFPCLELAYEVLKKGGIYPAALNAANEEAVAAFLNGQIAFTKIPKIIEKVLGKTANVSANRLKDVLTADSDARDIAKALF